MGKNNKRLGFWELISIREIRKEIERKRNNGKELTKEEKYKIAKQVSSDTKRRAAALGALGLLVTALGIGGSLALGSGTENEGKNTTQTEETEKIGDKENTFKGDLKPKDPISKLNSKEEVLKYFKERYVSEYNKNNSEEKLKEGDVIIEFSEGIILWELPNGEMILPGKEPLVTENKLKENGIDGYAVVELRAGENVMKVGKIEGPNKNVKIYEAMAKTHEGIKKVKIPVGPDGGTKNSTLEEIYKEASLLMDLYNLYAREQEGDPFAERKKDDIKDKLRKLEEPKTNNSKTDRDEGQIIGEDEGPEL